jgi:hypothetical protein
MTAPQAHPAWCSRASCTAYSTDELDRFVHRSKPSIVPTEDPFVEILVHAFADPWYGADIYLQLGAYEKPFADPWYDTEPLQGQELVLPLMRAINLRHVLASLIHVVRDSDGGTR